MEGTTSGIYECRVIDGKRININILGSCFCANTIDPDEFPQIFGNLAMRPCCMGIAIEPVRGEYWEKYMAGERFKMPRGGFQADSALVVFSSYTHVDVFIKRLEECKEKMAEKFFKKAEERHRDACRKNIIDINDITRMKVDEAATIYNHTGKLPFDKKG